MLPFVFKGFSHDTVIESVVIPMTLNFTGLPGTAKITRDIEDKK